MSSSRLSLCMIVKNEEAHLGRCLASVKPLASQMVVVDTGSTDRTVAIAREWGAEVLDFEWVSDFSAARNAGLERARGAWTLVLDADEWLEPAAQRALAGLCEQPPECAFELVQKSGEPGGGFIRNGIVRLFPNRAEIRFRHRIHEDVVGSLSKARIPIQRTEIEIEHAGYAEPGVVREKRARNRRIMERALEEPLAEGSESHVRFNLGKEWMDEGNVAEALEHFKWCIARAPAGSRTHQVCTIKAAECLVALGREKEARALLPEQPDRGRHPLEILLMARIVYQREPRAAVPWLETLLSVSNVTHVYPVNLGAMKLQAVTQLGRIALERGDVKAAAALIELGRNMKGGSMDAASEHVAHAYAAALTATAGRATVKG